MSTPAQRLADFAAGLSFSDLPAEVQARTRHVLATSIGLGFAEKHYPIADSWARFGADSRSEESLLLGRSTRTSAQAAAAFHSFVSHGLEFEDTHPAGPTHSGCTVMPVCVALAQAAGASGDDLLAGAAAGLELQCRMVAVAPGQFWKRGFYSTAVFGGPAAALGGSRTLRLPAPIAMNAFSLSTSFSGLTHEPVVGNYYPAKHAGVAWAVQGAVIAVRLAQDGYEGPPTCIDGRHGIYNSFVGAELCRMEVLEAGLGDSWHLLDVMIKQYPACHHGHAWIEAALKLRADCPDLEAIRSIECATTEPTAWLMWRPAETQRAPTTVAEAKFNLRYLIASTLVRGRHDLNSFEPERMADEAVWRVTGKMSFALDPSQSYQRFPADLTAVFADGSRKRYYLPSSRGGRESPETTEEMWWKFEQCVAPVLGTGRARTLWDALMSLETVKNVRELVPLMQP